MTSDQTLIDRLRPQGVAVPAIGLCCRDDEEMAVLSRRHASRLFGPGNIHRSAFVMFMERRAHF